MNQKVPTIDDITSKFYAIANQLSRKDFELLLAMLNGMIDGAEKATAQRILDEWTRDQIISQKRAARKVKVFRATPE